MTRDEILRELDTISGSRKVNSGFIKDKLKLAKQLAENNNFDAATMLTRLISAFCLFQIEEKLEALNKTLILISGKEE